MEDTITIIKRIGCLAVLAVLLGCNTAKLPAVSNKLEPVFKAHEKIYKQQDSWRHVQWEYKFGRQVIDSIFTEYHLQDSDDFYIITSTDDLANYSLEIKSYDKNIHLVFVEKKYKLDQVDGDLSRMSYNLVFKDHGGGDFIDFIKNTPQEELEDCHKKAPTENSVILLFTYYNKGNILVKRFQTCDYAGYYNWEIPEEDI